MIFKTPLPKGLTAKPNARLSDYTTFRLGGPCPLLLDCRTPENVCAAVAACRSEGLAFRLMGGGSNLLVSDHGIPEVVIRFESPDEQPRVEGSILEASAGVSFDTIASAAMDAGVAGFEFATGIPGTLGGAIVGNAGAFGQQIGDRVEWIQILAPDGSITHVGPEALHFSYRASGIAARGWMVLRARMQGTPGDRERIHAERDRIQAFRAERHPDWGTTPTAGSFFRNIEPTSRADRRQAAGAFLESAGATSMRVGAARTHPGHANIVITEGPAPRASDVWQLGRWMAAAAHARHGLRLIPEVRFWGTFE